MVTSQIENQELAALVDFYKKYRNIIFTVLLLCVLVIIASNYWQNKKATAAGNASQIFQEMVMAEISNDKESATAKGAQLLADYKSTPYAQFASLLLAKIAVSEGDLDKAAEKLRWVAAQNNAQDIAGHLATARLAAVLLQQGKLDEALALVDKDVDKAYTSLYAQARGDIYVAKGDLEQAKKAYMLAVQSLPHGVQSPLLQMKLLDLGGGNEPQA